MTAPETTARRTSRRCGARVGRGAYCRNIAGQGTDHPGIGLCQRHGGNSAHNLKAVGMQLAHNGIIDPDVAPGDVVQLEPHNGLLWSIWLAAGEAAYYNQELAKAGNELQSALDDDEPDPEFIDHLRGEIDKLYNRQRGAAKEMRSASKMALDAGLAERQVLLAERMAGMIADTIQDVVAQLGLSPAQEAALPDAITRSLLHLKAPDAVAVKRPKYGSRVPVGEIVSEQ